MLRKIELYVVEVIKGWRRGMIPCIVRGGLLAMSWVYRCVVAMRNKAFDRGWCRCYHSAVPVVSIGNIVAGGTGKTPAVLMFAKEFLMDHNIAILSRAYRSFAEKQSYPVLVGQCSCNICGDEPYLISKNFPQASVFAGRDRVRASKMAEKQGAQLIILDDGMQYRRLARDFEVIVIDGHDPFGKEKFLPAGFLREEKKALSRADFIIVNGSIAPQRFEVLKETLRKYTKAPVVAAQMEVTKIWKHDGGEVKSLQGKKVGMFCGIAHPEKFQKTLEDLGADVVAQYFVADHVPIQESALKQFAYSCQQKGAQALVCTEKDKVKYNNFVNQPLPVIWIQAKLSICGDRDEYLWKAFLKQVKEKVSQN